jgi:hypothetical protein
MSARTAVIVGVAVVMGCLILALGGVGQLTPAQAPRAPEKATARYQLVATGTGPASTTIYVIDTQTGRCWSKQPTPGARWVDLGTPAK